MTDKYFYTKYISPLGEMTIVCDEKENISELFFDDCKNIESDAEKRDGLKIFDTVKTVLDEYFSGKNPDMTKIPVKHKSTEFRLKIEKIIRNIPCGETITYGETAEIYKKEYGIKKISARAIGTALAKNPVLIIIPCHRVIGKNGKLTGYSGGIERKSALLKLEKIPVRNCYKPLQISKDTRNSADKHM